MSVRKSRTCRFLGRAVLGIVWTDVAFIHVAQVTASPFVINEIANNPRSDWGGNDFTGVPGAGAAGSTDEYVELKNVTATAQSLEGFILYMTDTSPEVDCFTFDATDPACLRSELYRVFDATGSEIVAGTLVERLQAVPPGGYVVLGNPAGDMLTSVTVSLVDTTSARIVDTLTLGGSELGTGSTGPHDEAVSRVPDGADTDNLASDFVNRSSTLGRANGALCSLTAGTIVINEVVSDPQSDWQRSDESGQPFDGTPGAGTIGSDDEYVELKNITAGPIDLRGCRLELLDATRENMFLETVDAPPGPYFRVFDSTGGLIGTAGRIAAVPSGGYVIIGDPRGTLNVSSVTIRLRGATVIDEAVPPSLNATGVHDEAASRFPDGQDTGDIDEDFINRSATPGRSNGTYCSLGAGSVRISEVVGDPQSDWNHSGGPGGAPFDGSPDLGTVSVDDEYVELRNVTDQSLDLQGCVLEMIDSTPEKFFFQEASSPGDPYVRVFNDTGVLVEGATIAAVPPGGYVVVGDPDGTINNGSAKTPTVITLRGTTMIDRVSFGDEAPTLNASGSDDEALMTLSDGDSGTPHLFYHCASTLGRFNGSFCDHDCAVTLNLRAARSLVGAMAGVGVAAVCPALDADADDDVDLRDFAALQAGFVGN